MLKSKLKLMIHEVNKMNNSTLNYFVQNSFNKVFLVSLASLLGEKIFDS